MKIAAVSNNGKTISRHFGRSTCFVVATIEDGEPVSWDTRDKPGCHDHQSNHQHSSPGHGGDAHHRTGGRHHQGADTVSLIADCEVVLARGMGQGMLTNLQQAGIRPFCTIEPDIRQAIQAYLEGHLEEHPERGICKH